MRRPSRAGAVKYLLVLIIIIGLATYIFIGGPKPASEPAGADPNRRQEVWDRIAQLESQRREMLIRAKGRLGSSSPRFRQSPRGAYNSGYREGFDQGYFEGSFLAENRSPNPLFFPIPRP